MFKIIIRMCACFVPGQRRRRKFRDYFSNRAAIKQALKIKSSYPERLKKLRGRAAAGQKIRVGFLVIYDSVFPLEPVFQVMLKDDHFSPFIIVAPDFVRKEDMLERMKKTYDNLSAKYDEVFMSYDQESTDFIDFSARYDLVCTANPYDALTHELYKIRSLARRGYLTFYATYGYVVSNYHEYMYKKGEYNLFWKVFVETEYALRELLEKTTMTPEIAVSTGYAKMDRLAQFEARVRERKRIIIAPHHTMKSQEASFSTFLAYADFFLDLPRRYPEIDFVFRPHPVFKYALAHPDCWGKERTEEYFAAMLSIKNVEYSDGDYFDLFVNSDALIHDCGSFMAEYLFTGHPCCYLLKDEEQNKKHFNDFARACLGQHYPAYKSEDIINFIEEVVIGGRDNMKEQRREFWKRELKMNYPHVGQAIVDHIKKEILS